MKKNILNKLTVCIMIMAMLILQVTNVLAADIKTSEKQFSFWVISDLHSGNSEGFYQQPKIRAALNDIYKTDPNTSAIITNGDNVESNLDGCWEQLVQIINDTIGREIPIYFTIGNHELKPGEGGTYKKQFERYLQYTNSVSAIQTDSVYYAHKINGQYFIHLGSQSQQSNGYADLQQEQLDWLKGALNHVDKVGSRAYVFLHQPLKNTVSGTDVSKNQTGYGVVQDKELREILEAHSNVIVFSGHTHIHLECGQPAFIQGKDKPSFFNDAALGKMTTDDGSDYEGSQGLCVEVYKDKVVVKGRDFANGIWISTAEYVVDIDDIQPTVEFFDEFGNGLTDFNKIIKTDKVNVHIELSNTIQKTDKATVVVAFYDVNGNIIELCTEEIADLKKDIDFTLDKSITTGNADGSVKVFVWDSLNTLVPLCKSMGI